MLYLKLKDKRNRQRFFLAEKQKLIKKFILIHLIQKLKNQKLIKPTFDSKLVQARVLSSLLKYSYNYLKITSKTRLVRRCLISNRSRSVLRPFGLSRIVLREFIQFGLIPGYRKAVW